MPVQPPAGPFADAARRRLESAGAFAGEVVPLVGMAMGRAGAVAESGPADSFGAEGRTASDGRLMSR